MLIHPKRGHGIQPDLTFSCSEEGLEGLHFFS